MAKKQKVSVVGDSVVKVEYPTIRKSVELDVSELTPEMQFAGLIHGIKQRLGDAASGGNASEKFEMASRIVEALESGQWEVTGGVRDDSGIVIEAVCRLKDMDESELTAQLDELDEEERDEKIAFYKSKPQVKAEIAKIRAERAEAAAKDADDFEV